MPEGVLFRDLDGEAVLLELGSGRYYGLNGMGTRMWNLLLEHGQLEPAFRDLRDEFEVAETELEEELLGFVDSLAAHRLLSLHDDG